MPCGNRPPQQNFCSAVLTHDSAQCAGQLGASHQRGLLPDGIRWRRGTAQGCGRDALQRCAGTKGPAPSSPRLQEGSDGAEGMQPLPARPAR